MQKEETEGKLRFYTPEQVRKLMAQAKTQMDIAIFTPATETGLRLSEVRSLKVSDVDFEAGTLIQSGDGWLFICRTHRHERLSNPRRRETRSILLRPFLLLLS